jgi:hypothetical protein
LTRDVGRVYIAQPYAIPIVIVLHEREILRQTGPFAMLVSAERRVAFFSDLNTLMTTLPVTLIATAIDKRRIPATTAHVYHLAMEQGLTRVSRFLREHQQAEKLTHLIVESRGQREDRILEQEFRRMTDASVGVVSPVPLAIMTCPKLAHSTGLQVADLVARPIGRHLLNTDQPNRAYEIVHAKLWRSPRGVIQDWGLTVLPL